MKNFMGKLKSLIMKHKGLFLVCVLGCVLLGFLLSVVLMMTSAGKDKYGNRLDDVVDLVIEDSRLEELAGILEEREEVVSANVRIQGKIIYIYLIFVQDTSIDSAKSVATSCLDNFSGDELSHYDVGIFIEEEREEGGFKITGSKHYNNASISWIRS